MYIPPIHKTNTDKRQKPSVKRRSGSDPAGKEDIYVNFTECLKVQLCNKSAIVENRKKDNM
jgi:hypothetical protein